MIKYNRQVPTKAAKVRFSLVFLVFFLLLREILAIEIQGGDYCPQVLGVSRDF